ncbi:patatin-like phospholipase family protein [Streptomyces sp. NBC_00988]|uniref:patatin-like phospholipase family protein n=1 Tax=Streptomyces sp. NBC_00988 TaxID=2903704 RepID=UPI00386F58C4
MQGTALVLGGGGPVGGAWMTGVLAGLAESGVDLGRADVIIGTSVGAIFGARLAAGETPQESYERQVTRADKVELRVTAAQTMRFLWAALGSRDPQRSVQRLGRAALGARSGPESELLDAVGTLLRGARDWPDRALRIAAVDAASGALETFDADSKVTLLEAVAANCAVPLVSPPVTAAGRRWMDGGSRTTANLYLAADHRHVLAAAPIPTAVGPHPSAQQQAAQLAAQGAEITLLTPDREARHAMGRDLTADARRPAAARAGHAQATALARGACSVARRWLTGPAPSGPYRSKGVPCRTPDRAAGHAVGRALNSLSRRPSRPRPGDGSRVRGVCRVARRRVTARPCVPVGRSSRGLGQVS